jgi:hypothetical protein
MDTLTTEQKGQIALAKVLLEAGKKGATAYIPVSMQSRADLLLEWQGKFYRCQVKYANGKTQHSQGAVRLDLRRRKRLYTKEEIDVLLVYIPQTDTVYWFGPEYFHQRNALFLRIAQTRNGQNKGCLLVDNFIW